MIVGCVIVGSVVGCLCEKGVLFFAVSVSGVLWRGVLREVLR